MAMKALFFEGVHEDAVATFSRAGYEVRTLPGSPNEGVLLQVLRDVNVLGVRSKTKITKAVLESAPELLVVGAYCIGVEHIDLPVAPLGASPCSMTLTATPAPWRNSPWGKSSCWCGGSFTAVSPCTAASGTRAPKDVMKFAVLTLGIVGYGKIGSQLSELAEAIGMKVIFCDVADVLARGNARNCTFSELLQSADVVSLHVDGKPQNRNLFGEEEFRIMKNGAFFLNLSRGFVVNHEALAENLRSGKLSGAAVDVFPEEPASGELFSDSLQNLPNVILTPHVGGSTEEAQQSIGQFVSAQVHRYLQSGSSKLSVNFPNCQLESTPQTHRLAHIHRNIPGMLLAISGVFADRGINVERQVYETKGTVGYAILDINHDWDDGLIRALEKIPDTIRFRVL